MIDKEDVKGGRKDGIGGRKDGIGGREKAKGEMVKETEKVGKKTLRMGESRQGKAGLEECVNICDLLRNKLGRKKKKRGRRQK